MAFGFDDVRQNGYLISSPSAGHFELVRIANGQYDPAQSSTWKISDKVDPGAYNLEVLLDRTASHPRLDVRVTRTDGVVQTLQLEDTAVSADFGGDRLGWYAYTIWEYDGTNPSWPHPVEDIRPRWGVDNLRAVAHLSGDANRDGAVDDRDLSLVLGHWGTAGGWAEGDFDANGTIDDRDLSIVLGSWGAGATAPAVPEPATLALLALGAVLLRRRRA